MRTWFWSLALTLTPALSFAQYGQPLQPAPAPAPVQPQQPQYAPAQPQYAPAPAQPAPMGPPPVGTDPYAAQPTVAGDATMQALPAERQGFMVIGRLMLTDADVSAGAPIYPSELIVPSGVVKLSVEPRYYLGYRLGKLGLALGLNFVNSSIAVETASGEQAELAGFGFTLAPTGTYELLATPSGNITLDAFGSILFGGQSFTGKGSVGNADAEGEKAFNFIGVDLGARLSGWLFPGIALGVDVAFHYVNVSATGDGNDASIPADADMDDSNDAASQQLGLYSALHLTGILLQ